jgi:hypothetical protein
VAETSVNKQSGLWIRRDHTLHIQCGNVTHYADGGEDRGLILMNNFLFHTLSRKTSRLATI